MKVSFLVDDETTYAFLVVMSGDDRGRLLKELQNRSIKETLDLCRHRYLHHLIDVLYTSTICKLLAVLSTA
jgi:hypothetical protein